MTEASLKVVPKQHRSQQRADALTFQLAKIAERHDERQGGDLTNSNRCAECGGKRPCWTYQKAYTVTLAVPSPPPTLEETDG